MVELISIHIPKTAGVSFEHTLKSVYRKDVLRLDIRKPHKPKKLPKKIRAIHGHFRYHEIVDFYNLEKNIPIITWLRDPVERVISNYFYLQKVFRELIEKEGKKGLFRLEKTLIEFARDDRLRNRMSKFLDGIQVSELLFVGIVEHISEDLSDMARLLNWRSYEEFHHNTSKEQRRPVSEDMKVEIRGLNEKDVALYEEALHLRRLRREK